MMVEAFGSICTNLGISKLHSQEDLSIQRSEGNVHLIGWKKKRYTC